MKSGDLDCITFGKNYKQFHELEETRRKHFVSRAGELFKEMRIHYVGL